MFFLYFDRHRRTRASLCMSVCVFECVSVWVCAPFSIWLQRNSEIKEPKLKPKLQIVQLLLHINLFLFRVIRFWRDSCVCVCWNLLSNSRTHKLALDILLDLRIEIYYIDSQLVDYSNNKRHFLKTNTNWLCAHFRVFFENWRKIYAQHICLFVYIYFGFVTRARQCLYIYVFMSILYYIFINGWQLFWVFVVRSGISKKRNKHFRIARNAARDWDSDRDWVDFQSASTSATSERNGTRRKFIYIVSEALRRRCDGIVAGLWYLSCMDIFLERIARDSLALFSNVY